MPLRSHVDLCLFIPVVHIPAWQIPEHLDLALRTVKDPREAAAIAFEWRDQSEAMRQLLFHETYHFWQGLRLPYLFRYALLAFLESVKAFRELNVTVAGLHDWQCTLPNLHVLDCEVPCCWFGGAQYGVGHGAAEEKNDAVLEVSLSPIALLECATSLAEWHSFRKAKASDEMLFSRWTKRNPSYLEPLRFAAASLENEQLALRCTLPLICAAFQTTQPVRTFVELLAALRGNRDLDWYQEFVAQREPCRWPELFELLFSKFSFDEQAKTAHLWPKEYSRIDLHDWVFSDAPHPTLTAIARRWHDAAERDTGYKWVLDLAAYARPEVFRDCLRSFRPPVLIMRFSLSDGSSRVFFVPGSEKVMEIAGIDGGPGAIADIYTMWSIVRRASGAHFDEDARLCHHSDCPEFKYNYCNLYPIVPENFESCGFLRRFDDLRNNKMFLPKEFRT